MYWAGRAKKGLTEKSLIVSGKYEYIDGSAEVNIKVSSALFK